MKIKWSGIGIVSGRGKLGGTVAARNRGGAYARNFAVPVNPRTVAQQFIRAIFGQLAAIWRTLSADARAAWNEATGNFPVTDIFGDRKELSGFNLFMSLNQVRQLLGLPILDGPPQPGSPQLIESFGMAEVDPATVNVDVSPVLTSAEGGILVYATAGMSPGITSPGTAFRLISTIDPNQSTTAPLFTSYSSVFGAPVAGTKIFLRFVPVNVNTGQQGTPFEASAIVQA